MILHTKRGPFNLAGEDILVNEDPVLPDEHHPYKMRLWVIGNEFGPIVALWADCDQDAMDAMLDKDYEQFLVEDPEDDLDGNLYAYLGNAGEACDLSYAWLEPVTIEKERDFRLCLAFAAARATGETNLEVYD